MSAKYVTNLDHSNDVKRLLRHRVSQEYFRDGEWIDNPREATSYLDVLEAAQACIRYGLWDVEMVLRCDHPAAADAFCTPLG
jgi:hypothetical protein